MREQRDKAEELGREVLQLKKRLLQEKSVTPSNGNPVSFAAMVDLLSQAAKARSKSALLDIREGISWKDGVVGNTKVTDNQLAQLIAAMTRRQA
ncbi:hypothetical protein A3768_1990 [Ralstonia solanacearum]|nr:hypothetical protein A3768_1990 [Ralstonia solanacearum]